MGMVTEVTPRATRREAPLNGGRLARAAWARGVEAVYRQAGPPRVLIHRSHVNVRLLRRFGATVGDGVRVHPPLVLHAAESGYANLVIGDGCLLNGNNFLDLSGPVMLEAGVSLGPGVTVMTHNRFNYNRFLEDVLAHQCGVRGVRFKRGAGIKAAATVVMGITVGEDSVVAAGSVVNRDVADRTLVAGVPAAEVRRLDG
jgi:acetyltransferase-like isoleucine patch superfamily enzyme